MANSLTFQLGADVSPALQAMTAVEQRTLVLQQRIQSLQNVIGSTQSVQKLNQAMGLLGKSQAELARVSAQAGKSLSNVAPGSNEATQSLINLSRVAQDAPFGFLGIANNLNPLLESFQRLKATTGTTGGALKALTGVLAGPAGLGLAVGVGSSLLLTFGDRLFGASKASKEAQEEIKKLAEAVATDLVKVTSLVGLAGNVNASYENRAKAIKALNEQYGKYLPGLDKEKINAENLAQAYDKITQSLLNQAVVKGAQNEIEKIVAETAKQILTLKQQEAQAVRESNKEYEKEKNNKFVQPTAQQALEKYVKAKEGEIGVVRDGNIALQQQTTQQNIAIKQTNIYDALVNKLTADLKNQLQPLMNLTTEFSDLDESLKSVGNNSNDTISKAKALAKELEKIGAVVPDFTPFQTEAEQLQIAQRFLKQFATVSVPFKFKADLSQIDVPPPSDGGLSPVAKELERNGAILGQSFNQGVAKAIETGGEVKPENIRFRNLEALRKRNIALGQQLADSFNQSFSNSLQSGFEAVGEGLGNLLSGQDFGSSILNVLSELLSGIGKALISYGIVKEGLDKILGAGGIAIPGGVAIALGALAIASSQIVKNFGGAREKGGPVAGNTAYLVGERGPELFVPSVSGNIVPNNQLGAFNGRPAFAAAMGGRSIVRGTDILLASARSQRSINRVNA